jgi:hypothetical protein
VLVVSGRDSSPVLEVVERPLDDVAILVVVSVEADGPAAARAALLAVPDLITGFGDDGGDPASS